MQILENYPLKKHNTFQLDVYAKYFFEIKSLDDLHLILKDKNYRKEKKLILGGGSNVLFQSDYDGLILWNNLKGIHILEETNEFVLVKFNSGENWHECVLHSLDYNWFGLENLSLIPGKMGAAPIQNIGAYGVEIKDLFHELTAFRLDTLELKTFNTTDCRFGYRNSIFKTTLKNKICILDVTLKLLKEPQINISYQGIKNYLDEHGIKATHPKEVSDAVIAVRKSKLPDPDIIGNGGSFFKNPVITIEEYHSLLKSFPNLPSFHENDTQVKLPAAYLIQECGWKGYRKNDAGAHSNQPLVIVNYGNATGKELVELARRIQHSVRSKFHIKLEPEVNII